MTNDIAPVPGFSGYYVSRDGVVYSSHQGWRRLALQVDNRGYTRLRLTRDGGARPVMRVHQLVLLAHVGPRPTPSHEGRHLNGNNRDNRSVNLAWGSRADNWADAVGHGTAIAGFKGEAALRARLTEAQAIEIERRAHAGESDIALGQEFGISPRSVYGIRNHETWRHLWTEAA